MIGELPLSFQISLSDSPFITIYIIIAPLIPRNMTCAMLKTYTRNSFFFTIPTIVRDAGSDCFIIVNVKEYVRRQTLRN
jgi:hypothetical protein